MRLLLCSQSPRRRELLAGLDIPFRIVTVHADESYPHDLQGGDIPLYIARQKAHAWREPLASDEVLITADTIVWCDGQMLGKPRDHDDACRMLRMLSGRAHQVYTAVVLRTAHDLRTFCDCTDVTFRALSDSEIDYYVRTYHPLDKAGAYGIQEWIGYVGVTDLRGSYFNVMGLPVHRLYEALTDLAL